MDHLDVSEDRKSVKVKTKNPVSEGRGFVPSPLVLGCERFSTGRHFWEVILGGTGGWAVGVGRKAPDGEGQDPWWWMIGKWSWGYMALSQSGCSELVLTEEPRRIRICLNCEGGQVSFFDAKTAALLHTFSCASLVGETLQPFFWLETVILDPDTAKKDHLDVSEDRKSVKVKIKNPVLNGEGFVILSSVLGCQTFSTGRHFWEVIVGGTGKWCVGVARKAPDNVWSICWIIAKWSWGYQSICPSGRSKLVLTEAPKRIRICLNCEEGQVSFFDAKTAALLHTFSDASLVGETLRPYFCLGVGTSMTLP